MFLVEEVASKKSLECQEDLLLFTVLRVLEQGLVAALVFQLNEELLEKSNMRIFMLI
jgi:hypothetical protein